MDGEWDIVKPFGDNEHEDIATRWHVEIPDDDEFDPTQPTSSRIREDHPNQGRTNPGGLNRLQSMDQDKFSNIRDTENVYYPFASSSEWELAKWLSSGALSQREIDQYLHLPHVSL